MKRPIERYVNSLADRRRPKRFSPSEEDLAVARAAIDLAAAGPDGRQPREEFIDELRRRLTALENAPRPEPARPVNEPEPVKPASHWTLGRRRMLTTAAVTATAAVGAIADHVLTGSASQPSTAPEGELRATTGTWQTVAADADLPEGAVLSFEAGAVMGFLQRVSGRVQAVSGICTHQGCRLNLTAPRTELACPCHGATFSLAGRPLTRPHGNGPLPALPRLPVRVVQGDIQIYTPTGSAT